MRISLIWFICALFIVTGCMNDEELGSQQKIDPKPIRLSTGEENKQIVIDKNPGKDYYQSDEEGLAHHGTERNIFETREAMQISRQLAKREEIHQTRVAITANRVIIFASLNKYPNDIEKIIEKEASQFVKDKQIVVFTDKVQWERMKQLESGQAPKEMGENAEQFLEEYFNIEIKD